MFRFFENLVDPYTAYDEVDTPPTRLWPFLLEYSQPFREASSFWTALLVDHRRWGRDWVDLLHGSCC